MTFLKNLVALPFNLAGTLLLFSMLPFWAITKALGVNWIKLYD